MTVPPPLNPISIQSFLKLGYFIEYAGNRRPLDFSHIERARYVDVPRDELVGIGRAKLRQTFAALFPKNMEHVVPLSGGLDSRLILAALLEHTEARNIHTYTFGIPGCYDYEIAAIVAKRAGTRHVTFPMNRLSCHRDDIVAVAKREDCQAVLFYNQPLRELERLFGGGLFWSGFVGDAVAGSHLHSPPSASLQAAKRLHLANRTFVRSTRLHRATDDEFLPYMGETNLPPELLTWDEQVLFSEAVPKFTVAHVLLHGFSYLTPLINTPWMDFMFSVPNRYRFGSKLMIDVGRTAFPQLFDLPSKNRLGHTFDTPDAVVRGSFWINRVRRLAHQFLPGVSWPNVLYNDFDEGIRTSRDMREVVRGALNALERRQICDWVDFSGLWRRHELRLRNHGDALVVLASLELLLQAREEMRAS